MDPSGGVVPGAKVILINSGTGIRQETSTTPTGNYAIASLSVGRYTLAVEQPGFTRYEQSNILVQVAETTRVDVTLKVGQATESVQVSADASMLKTESAEQSSSLAGDTINTLPMNYGIGAGAIRNPLSFVQLTPGSMMTGWNTINVNGLPGRLLPDSVRRPGIEQRPGWPRLRRGAAVRGGGPAIHAADV